jgi:cytochrome oxidase Cu insertion factor (SCO1/SenC/PrrC family)
MLRMTIGLAGSALLLALSTSAARETPQARDVPEVNAPAPDFELKDSTGKTHRLSQLRGKNVILEFIRSGSW